jgi:hypothetical protein
VKEELETARTLPKIAWIVAIPVRLLRVRFIAYQLYYLARKGMASANHFGCGCFEDSVCIRMIAQSILAVSRKHHGCKPLSIFIAAVSVVLKPPVLTLVASL